MHRRDTETPGGFLARIFKRVLLCALCVSVATPPGSAQQESAVTFQDHILPIFSNHCLGCHNADKKKGDLDLSTYSGSMAGGGSGDVVAPGDASASLLFKVVAHLAEPKMPPKKARISDAEIATLKKWIDGGLIEAKGGAAKKSKGPKVDLALKAVSTGKPQGPAPMPQDYLLEPQVRTAKAEAVTALAASPWAPVVAVGGQHQVLLYNTDTLDLAGILSFPERRPTILRFSRNGSLLLAGGGRGAKLGRVVLWDVKTGDRVTEIGEEFDQVLAADVSPDQTLIALGGPGKLVKIYGTQDGDLNHSIKKHTDWVTALEFSPDGVLLATGDRSGGLHVWEARTGRIFYTLNGHKGPITGVSWRSDANLLASSSEDGQVMLWELANGTRVKGWQAHPSVASVNYSQDGKLVTCGRDMVVRTWDGTGNKLKDFEAFTDLALRAVFSHDGGRVIAGDWTGEIRVWTAADAKRVGQLSTNPPSIAERLAADTDLLEEAIRKARVLSAPAQRAADAANAAAGAAAASARRVTAAQAALAAAGAKLAEADKAAAAAAQGVSTAQSALAARQNEAGDKAKALKKAQEALKQSEGDPGRKDALPKLAEAAKKAKAEAEAAANAMGPAQKALTEAQGIHKQATDAKAAAQAAHSDAKKALAASQAQAEQAKKQADAAKAAHVQAKQAVDDSAAALAKLQTRIAGWKAAQFNVQVHAAGRELAKIQAELEVLGSKGEEARKAAAEADAKAKAGEQAVAAARSKIQERLAALGAARAAPAQAELALRAAQKVQTEKDARAAAALPLANLLAESLKQSPDNKTLAQAAAKARETVDLLTKDAADAQTLVAARAADIDQARVAIPAAEKAVAEAQVAATRAEKTLAELRAAAKAAADRIAPEQAQAEAFRPKVEAARAKVEALKAEYLKLKPKSL